MKSLYISYSKENKKTAKRLVSKLESDGYSCWINPRDLPSGVRTNDAIKQAIDESELFILIYSKYEDSSEIIIKEYETAEESEKPIIPFKVGEIPKTISNQYLFNTLDWVDAHEDGFDQAYEILLEVIEEFTDEKPIKRTQRETTNNKSDKQQKQYYIAAFAIFAAIIVGYFLYDTFVKSEKEQAIVGTWKVVDYNDNLKRNKQDSALAAQNINAMMQNASVTFNDDFTFERIGFTPQPEIGQWSIEDDGSILFLEPEGGGQKDELFIKELTFSNMILSVNEKVNKMEVITLLTFQKQ